MSQSRSSIVVVGAGGHAKVVIELLREMGVWTIVGLTDHDTSPRTVAGVEVLGGDEAVCGRLRSEGVGHAIVAVGDNALRLRLGGYLRGQGYKLATAISPAAHVSASARIGDGVAIMAGAVVNADAAIGDLCILNTLSGVDHDCVLGEAVHVAPGTVLAGNVAVGARSFIGAGASVIPGVRIGSDVTVGAGATVVDDLPDGVTAIGTPARWSRPQPVRTV